MFKLGAWIENGDRPWLNIVLGLKRGQTLFKLNASKKGGQTLFKLSAGIKKGTDLHLNPITAFAKKICESKKKSKKNVFIFY
ncbi:MAG: hypothetical protein SPE03_03370 [Treponema sp.]|nr:hypothetical protein [Treponema sp.]